MASSQKKRIDGINADVLVTKRKASKRIKMSLKPGVVSVSIPTYIPFRAGFEFANRNRDWINQKVKPANSIYDFADAELYDGTKVTVQIAKRSWTKIHGNKLRISVIDNQEKAEHYIKKAISKHLIGKLKPKIERYIDELGLEHELYPEQIKYKNLKSRWGSCTNFSVLTFSSYLAQVPDQLIRYVVCHELAHLRHLDHSSDFWSQVEVLDPDYKKHRKQLKDHQLDILIKKA